LERGGEEVTEIRRRAGIYRIIDDGLDVGTEAWTREVGPDGIRLTSVINRIDDEEFEEEIEITLDAGWNPLEVNVERTSTEGDRRYVGRRVGDAWISQIFRESGPMRTVTLPFDDETHVDYFTPHTNSVTIQRLALSPETGQEIEVVFIDPDTYTPTLVRQKYARLANPEPFEVAGATVTRAYHYQGASGFESTIWTEDNGIILRYEDLFEALDISTA
jgi:hypothetical protein